MGSLRDMMRRLPPLGDRLRSRAVEVLFKAIDRAAMFSTSKRPGAVIEKLSQEDRRLLKYLSSEDISNVRIK
jgi:hypothetical protein